MSDPAFKAPDPPRDALDDTIDNALRRLFAPVPGSADTLAAKLRTRRTVKLPAWRLTGIAAAILVLVIGNWWVWTRFSDQLVTLRREVVLRSLDAVYHDKVSSGYQPLWICDPNDQPLFASATDRKFGIGLAMVNVPASVVSIGWDYQASISPKTALLMTYVDRQPVIVFIDAAECPPQRLPANDSGLQSFSRKIDGLHAYEVTPLGQPHVLELLRVAK